MSEDWFGEPFSNSIRDLIYNLGMYAGDWSEHVSELGEDGKVRRLHRDELPILEYQALRIERAAQLCPAMEELCSRLFLHNVHLDAIDTVSFARKSLLLKLVGTASSALEDISKNLSSRPTYRTIRAMKVVNALLLFAAYYTGRIFESPHEHPFDEFVKERILMDVAPSGLLGDEDVAKAIKTWQATLEGEGICISKGGTSAH